MKSERWQQIDQLFHAASEREPEARARLFKNRWNENHGRRTSTGLRPSKNSSAGGEISIGISPPLFDWAPASSCFNAKQREARQGYSRWRA